MLCLRGIEMCWCRVVPGGGQHAGLSVCVSSLHSPAPLSSTNSHPKSSTLSQGEELVEGDVFYFDYGVVVIWGLSQAAEREVIRSLAGPALVDPLSPQEVEIDEFNFYYTANERPHIQNDTFTSRVWGGEGGHAKEFCLNKVLV